MVRNYHLRLSCQVAILLLRWINILIAGAGPCACPGRYRGARKLCKDECIGVEYQARPGGFMRLIIVHSSLF